jgi:hypothetical protein
MSTYRSPSIESLKDLSTPDLRQTRAYLMNIIAIHTDKIESGESADYDLDDLDQWHIALTNVVTLLKQRFETIDADSERSASESEN